MEVIKVIGENIKKIREAKLMGLNETARLANISGSYLSNIEKGIKTNPSIEALKRIANVFDVQVEEFFKDHPAKENLNMAMDSIIKISEMAKQRFDSELNKQINKINGTVEATDLTTIATHFDGEKFTEGEKEDIENFIKYVLSKRKVN